MSEHEYSGPATITLNGEPILSGNVTLSFEPGPAPVANVLILGERGAQLAELRMDAVPPAGSVIDLGGGAHYRVVERRIYAPHEQVDVAAVLHVVAVPSLSARPDRCPSHQSQPPAPAHDPLRNARERLDCALCWHERHRCAVAQALDAQAPPEEHEDARRERSAYRWQPPHR